MRLDKTLFSFLRARTTRQQWVDSLVWFRLRYLDAAGPTRCLRLLSRPGACGRIALCYQPGRSLSRLYVGLPAAEAPLLQRMAADFRFSLQPATRDEVLVMPARLSPAAALPWARPFLAQMVDEALFIEEALFKEDGPFTDEALFVDETASPLPPVAAGAWGLPANPPPGLTLQPVWPQDAPPTALTSAAPDAGRWLLGRAPDGTLLQTDAPVNVYGQAAAVAEWLAAQVTQTVSLNAAGLVVIDGAGDLVPRLKRQTAVTRRLGESLVYVDVDNPALPPGFNPLAALPGEEPAVTLRRWQRWLAGMGIPSTALAWLSSAQQAGVTDLSGLRRWLRQAARQGASPAGPSLEGVFAQLQAGRGLRPWLAWPLDRFAALPDGALLFACQGSDWARQQLLRAVWLAAQDLGQFGKPVRIVGHGLPWGVMDGVGGEMPAHSSVRYLTSNGPLQASGITVLVQSPPRQQALLAERFLAGNAQWQENLALLRRGEGVVIAGGDACLASWRGRETGA